MTDDRQHVLLAPRARPVADLASDAVLARAEELARRWAIALIRARPLEDIGEIAFEQLAREAPALCAQALRALQSDVELDRLTGTGTASSRADSAPARRLAVIAGAEDPVAAVVAVEALRGVLWEALLDELHEPSPRQIGDIADRLACVCAPRWRPPSTRHSHPSASAAVDVAEGSSEGGDVASSARYASVGPTGRRAVIVDERAGVRPGRRGPAASPTREQPPAQEHPLPWDVSSSPSTPGARADEIEIRDVRDVQVERGEQGPAAWIGSIGRQLERFKRDGLSFAVLLVELVDVERLREEETPAELTALAARMEQALAAELGSSLGSLTRERPGRCWLLAPRDRPRRGTRAGRAPCARGRLPHEQSRGPAGGGDRRGRLSRGRARGGGAGRARRRGAVRGAAAGGPTGVGALQPASRRAARSGGA